jgi:hypothetical protein
MQVAVTSEPGSARRASRARFMVGRIPARCVPADLGGFATTPCRTTAGCRYRLQADSSIDEFADNISVASVPVRLGDHVHQHPQQRHLALVAPPRHLAGRIERQGADGLVGVRAGPAVKTDVLLARLCGSSVELGVGVGVLFESGRKRPAERTPERVAEVPGLDTAQCLTSPSRLVPVGVSGRRMSYSASPSSFQSTASRALCR